MWRVVCVSAWRDCVEDVCVDVIVCGAGVC